LLGTVVVAGVALGGGGGGGDAGGAVVTADASTTVAPTITDPPPVESVATTAPVQKTPLDRVLAKGMFGEDVKAVQQRLADLGFRPGPADGMFGDQTRTALWAYQKLVLGEPSDRPSGQVTPEMWDEMQDPFVIQPRRPDSTPTSVEVYLPEQVLAIFEDDRPIFISHMSSGDGTEWCEEVTISPGEIGNEDGEEPLKRGECGVSLTPGGVFTVHREVEGVRQSGLGGMWDPVYFNYGIAIHGALNVPLYPASHGCIRIPLNLSEEMQDLIDIGDRVFVWDGEKSPEENGEQLPRFNWIDPDYETTTTTSTTTTTEPESTTTEAPATTTAPATTPAPATTAAPSTAAPTTVPAPPSTPASTAVRAPTTTVAES